MKKWLLFLLLLVSANAAAQGQRAFSTSAVAADVGINLTSSGVAYHKLTWYANGTVSTCTAAVDSSADGVSWSAGGVITGQTCTTNGASAVVNTSVNYIRINVTTISGGGTVTAVWNGYVNNPVSGAGTVTSSGSPVSGNIPKFTTATNIAPAAASDIVNLFSTCSGTQYLGADGACHTAGGGGTVTTTGSPANTQCATFSGATSITGVAGCTVTSGGDLVLAGAAGDTANLINVTNSNTSNSTGPATLIGFNHNIVSDTAVGDIHGETFNQTITGNTFGSGSTHAGIYLQQFENSNPGTSQTITHNLAAVFRAYQGFGANMTSGSSATVYIDQNFSSTFAGTLNGLSALGIAGFVSVDPAATGHVSSYNAVSTGGDNSAITVTNPPVGMFLGQVRGVVIGDPNLQTFGSQTTSQQNALGITIGGTPSSTTGNWGIYEYSSAPNYLGGNCLFLQGGASSGPGACTAKLLVLDNGGVTAGTNAQLALSVTGANGGATIGTTNQGWKGGGESHTAGNGSAAGATSGNGGAGGDIAFTTGTGGNGTSGSFTGKGGDFLITLGSAGGSTGTVLDPGTFTLTGGTVGGSRTKSLMSITETLNTSGVIPGSFVENLTCTAAGANTKEFDFQIGGVSQFNLSFTGSNCATPLVTSLGNITAPTVIGTTSLKSSSLVDANGNVFLASSATGSAVDSVTITNAATANPATVTIAATGTDTNINTALNAKGSGTVNASTFLQATSNRVFMTADWTCGTGGTVSSCTSATIIGSGGGTALTLTLPLQAISWHWRCDGVVSQTTGVTANNWNMITATNGATNVTASYTMGTAAAVGAFGATTDQASTTTTFNIGGTWTLGSAGTKFPFHIDGFIEGASASGTVLSLQVIDPTVGDLLTIYRGASCSVSSF